MGKLSKTLAFTLIIISGMLFTGLRNYDRTMDDSAIYSYIVPTDILGYNNLRLRQHIAAIKYNNIALNEKNIRAFLSEAEILNPEEYIQVSIRETSLGKAGVGKSANNLYGMRRANNRFSWSTGQTKNGYSTYENPYFSILDYCEFKLAGNHTWRKDLKLKTKTSITIKMSTNKKHHTHHKHYRTR